ncbi:MAG: Mut7-C RNAse domain-containing protein [Bacteroidota bacterium]
MPPKSSTFRFYEELNDFIPGNDGKKDRQYDFFGHPKVKDAIESFGIPHTEVDLIIANGIPVNFDYQIKNNDRIAVYPKFETLDISKVTKLNNSPLRTTKFILDVHLGKLARYLRLLGFDTLYSNDYEDDKIIDIASKENRIILTRDKVILRNNKVTHGYYIRSDEPKEQLREVIKRFDLSENLNIFSRCMDCNGKITSIRKKDIQSGLMEGTKKYYTEFFQCKECNKIYWKGSHFQDMMQFIESILKETNN